MSTITFQKLHPRAVIPSYAHDTDAGMDLHTVAEVVLRPGASALLATGIACALPRDTVGLIWDKSGLATSKGLKVMGGVVDSGYRGEIMVGLMNLGKKTVTFEVGHKIAQLLVQKVEHPRIRTAQRLTTTKRGAGGFGSTGK